MHDPDFHEQQLVQAARSLESQPLQPAERRAEFVVGSAAVVASAALWLLPVAGELDVGAALLCAAAILVSVRVRFDVGGGFTNPVQLAFVPLLFAVPAQVIPLAVMVCLVLTRVPEVLRGAAAPSRLALAPGNAWFCIGPAAVLVAIGGADALLRDPAYAIVVFGAQFAGDLLASGLRHLLFRGASIREQLEEAAWVYGVDALLTPVPLTLALTGAGATTALVASSSTVVLIASFARERHKRLDSLLELNNAYHGTALLLGDVVEADDSYTGEHSRGVVELALDVGRELELTAERLRNLEFSALLHDVGKVAIPKEIINKPGRLDPREWEVIKTHTVEGHRMLDRIGGFMGDVGLIVRSHHERWDGEGYPDGLAGEEIPLEARIVSACDSYNAITTTRPYRQAQPVDVALRELREHAGTQFDPEVVKALVATVCRGSGVHPSGLPKIEPAGSLGMASV